MSSSSRRGIAAALVSLIAGIASAEPQPPSITRAPRDSAGVQVADQRAIGGGPAYRTAVTRSGFEFTPAFGSAAERTYPWTYELLSIGRADGTVSWEASAESELPSLPDVDGVRASITRGPHVVERYDHRTEGVEQSFAFATRPRGAGDLIVRARVTTDLVGPNAGSFDDGVTYAAEGVGSFTLGRVLGVDENGVKAPGSIRVDGSTIEYVLPASFVDGAAYPLVLDPLFGGVTAVASGFDEEDPDAAFEASFNTWCVVWRRIFSSSDSDVRAQRVDTNGNLIGGLIVVDATSAGAISPRVANITRNEDFVVVWAESTGFLNSTIKARVVKATTAALSNKLDVGPTTGLNIECDVSGEYLEIYSHALVVWRQYDSTASQWQIVGARIGLPDAAPPLAFSPFVIASGYADEQPSVSQTGGQFGFTMVAWKRVFTDLSVEIRGAIVDRLGNIADSFIAVSNSAATENAPSVDGDGHNFVVAYESQSVAGAASDILMQRVSLLPNGQWGAVGSVFAIGLISPDVLKQPGVAWMSGSVVGSYRQQVGTHYESRLFAYEPFGLQSYESTASNPIGVAGVHDESTRIAWGLGDYVMAAIEREAVTPTGSVVAYRHTSVDGLQESLGNNCGGRAYAMGAKVGNPNFRLQLTAADPMAPTYLILSASAVNVQCGNCTLVANPSQGLLLAMGNTDANGELGWTVGIPNNPTYVGLPFITQWLTVDNATPGCPSLGVNFSSTVKTTLQ